jgi:hypothetical protein
MHQGLQAPDDAEKLPARLGLDALRLKKILVGVLRDTLHDVPAPSEIVGVRRLPDIDPLRGEPNLALETEAR